MKTRVSPVQIALKDLPLEGRSFTYTRESGELNEFLGELVGQNPYKVDVQITPMGNAYDMRGTIQTGMNLQCSLCALDLKHPINERIHEMLVLQKPLNKGDQQSKANHAHEWVEDGPDYIMLESDSFHVGEYVREVVALNEPIRPLGKPDCDLQCENVSDEMRKWLQGRDAISIRTNPFQALEKIKLKS